MRFPLLTRARVLGAFLALNGPVSVVSVVGCGGVPPEAAWTPELRPTQDEGQTDAERAALSSLEGAPTETSASLGGGAEAGVAYQAASGRVCREVTGLSRSLLACRFEEGWRFVPGYRDTP